MFSNAIVALRFFCFVILLLIFSSLAVFAQTTDRQADQQSVPSTSATIPLSASASGLSFRYVRSFGEVATPYLVDTTHINRPHGLFMDTNNNLFIAEEQGKRVLKYNANGANLLAIGKAGMCYTADSVLCTPYDMVTDSNGNLWVADGNRIVQYSASGAFLQQMPTENASQAGNDNTHFDSARGIAISPSGLLFIADTLNHRIQIYTLGDSAPVYSTTIGLTDQSGADNNHFNQPQRLAVDSLNRLYVVDKENNRVQRCVLATNWTCDPFTTDLKHPQGIAVDGSDNVFVADTENGRIIKCSASGLCGTFAADMEWAYDVAVDNSGNVYGGAAYDDIVYKLNSSGQFVGIFAGIKFKPYLTDSLHYNHPRLTIDKDGNLIIVEENGQRVIKVDPNGNPLWTFGEPGVDRADNEHFAWPHGVTTDSAGNVYVADDTRVQILSPNGTYLTTLGEGRGKGALQFDWANGVAVDKNGTIYVSDGNNHRVQVYNSARQYIATMGVTAESGADNAHFNYPLDVEVDTAGNIYVSDIDNCRVQKFNTNRIYQMTFGKPGSCSNALTDVGPEEVAIDAEGRVYIAGWSDRVQVFDSNGSYLATIGGVWGERSGEFRAPFSVALDKAGNVYVADLDNARIQVFAPGTPGWQQANLNGFGERTNESVTALEVFNGQLFAGVTNYMLGGTLWHSTNGTAWQRTTEPGFSTVLSATNPVIFDLIEFKSKLYAATGVWWSDGNAGQIWRTGDGAAWEQVVDNGFGNPRNNGIVAFGTFKEQLYAATINDDGLEIWRSATGNSNDWTRVVSAGFGGGGTYNISYPFQTFNDQLYVGVESMNDKGGNGLRLFRTADGTTWTQANQDGFGNKNNNHPGAMAAFQGLFYASTRNDITGGQLWRSSDGQQWTQVIGNGFGNLNNHKIEALTVFDNALYAVASNSETGIEVWRTGDGTNWQQVNADGFGSRTNEWTLWSHATAAFNNSLYLGVTNYATGGTLWQTVKDAGVFLPLVRR